MKVDFDDMYLAYDIPWDTGVPSNELGRRLAAGEIPTPARAVDLGCGTGTNVIYLAQWGFEAVGIDASARALQLAQEKANNSGLGRAVRLVLGDVLRVRNVGEPFDFIFDRGCYHHVRTFDLECYLATLEAFARPGALYLSLAGNAKEKTEMGPPRVTEAQIRDELGGLFEILDLREFLFDPSPYAGDFRPLGWSCLLQRKS